MHKTMRDYVEEKLVKEVFGHKSVIKINPRMTMDSFVPDKKFLKEYKDMFADKIESVFGCSGRNLKSLSVIEIIEYITKIKEGHAKYGNRPFKKSRY